MKYKFIETHNAGNDFILFDTIEGNSEIKLDKKKIIHLCHRQFGIGADGILLLSKEDNRCRMRIYNNDGSLAKMCGNGLSALSAYVYKKGYVDSNKFEILTDSGIRIPEVKEIKNRFEVKIDMGKPLLISKEIPVISDNPDDNFINQKLTIGDKDFTITAISMGNPHAIIYTDEEINLHKYGPLIENHSIFPDRINVEFVKIISPDEVEIKVWERGAGPTLACGTGTSAVSVAGVITNRTNRKIKANLPGGVLLVEYPEDNGSVFLTCSPLISYTGEVEF